MIMLDEEWNAGKRDQAYARIDRMGQTEETCVHVLRLEKTIDTWMADLIASKEDMVAGFENNVDLANSLLNSMRNGDVL
jgi:SNF2 family DNA or RNA helicase